VRELVRYSGVLAGEMADDVTERQMVEPGAVCSSDVDRFRRDVVEDRLVGGLAEHDRTEVPRMITSSASESPGTTRTCAPTTARPPSLRYGGRVDATTG
jgi:hypothetical protein